MESKAKLFGHPVHQMLIVFPLGLLATSAVFDILYLATGSGAWSEVSFWIMLAGVVGGLIAAVFGLIDWLAIPPGTRAFAVGALHGIGNVIVLALFFTSWFFRTDHPQQPRLAEIILSFAGVGLALVTGWLGGELVDRFGVGVHAGANLNAPNSLASAPARRAGPTFR
jgi:uncharacterized membrane protein